MIPLLLAAAFCFAAGIAANAEAACTNQLSSAGSTPVGTIFHVTQVTASPACVPLSPGSTVVTGMTHTSVVPDSTGWNITGNTVGQDGLTFTPTNPNYAPVVYSVNVTANATVLTSP